MILNFNVVVPTAVVDRAKTVEVEALALVHESGDAGESNPIPAVCNVYDIVSCFPPSAADSGSRTVLMVKV